MPFKSEAQRRFFHAAEERGDLPKGISHRWEHETPKKKKENLPYHVKKASHVGGGIAASMLGEHHRDSELKAATKRLKKVTQEKTSMTSWNSFIDEFQKIAGAAGRALGARKAVAARVAAQARRAAPVSPPPVAPKAMPAASTQKAPSVTPEPSAAKTPGSSGNLRLTRLGAGAVGAGAGYLASKALSGEKEKSAAYARAAKKLKKMSMGAYC